MLKKALYKIRANAEEEELTAGNNIPPGWDAGPLQVSVPAVKINTHFYSWMVTIKQG
jgi:hypothetical protein